MIATLYSLIIHHLLPSLLLIFIALRSASGYTLSGNTLTDLTGTGSNFYSDAAGWQFSGLLHPPTTVYDCAGSLLLGGYGILTGTKGGWYQRKYENLPSHNQITMKIMVWPLDSWDGSNTDDHFEFSFDGVKHYGWRLSGFAGYAKSICGASGWLDYPSFEARITIPHTGSTLTFTVHSELDEGSENESVGFRDITMTFETVSSPVFSMCGSSPGSPLPTSACECPKTNQYQTPPNSGACYDCHASCKTCTGGTSANCLTCYDGTYFSGNQCLPCSTNCKTCYGGGVDNCITCNTTHPFMVNSNQCVADCVYPLTTGMNGAIQTCNTPCPGQYVFTWDSFCSNDCSTILLSQRKYNTFDVCDYPCSNSQYQYWDAVCGATCAYPLAPRVFHTKNFCDFPCSKTTDSLYWDQGCESTCPSPLKTTITHGRILCEYTCADDEYLYWDKSCGKTCYYPQVIRFYKNKKFCDFSCTASQFLYWNNSCISTCPYPLVTRSERSVKFCDFPCSGSQFLYWNGSCLATCNSPLVSRIEGSSRFCDFPCADNVMLRWDGVCGGSCLSPRVVKAEGSPMVRTFCVFPCADNEYLYWNGSCISACNLPLVSSVQQSKNFCTYPCTNTQFLYWNGSCKDSCLSPLTQRLEATLNYCDYKCATSEYLYWNGSCKTSCSSPLTAKTIDGNRFCYYPCNTNQFLYWDGSCRSSCPFPHNTRVEASLNYCDYPCSGSNYLYWNGSCLSTCASFTSRVDSTKNYCDFPCADTAFLYWDGACSGTCDSPLTYYTEGSPMVRKFCTFPCATPEFLYWNGTCSTSCNFPLTQRTQNSRKFCSLPCADMSNFLYWNGSCKTTCPSPLVTRIESSKYCDYPCLGSQYLYWNGSCQNSCAFPLTSQTIDGNNFCQFTCTDTTNFLYWDGSCSSSCSPNLQSVTEGTPIRNYCRFKCNTNEHLYWNGSCIVGCSNPLTSTLFKSRYFCSYPCSTSQYLYWDKSCVNSCPYPLVTRVEGTSTSNNYCDYPCSSGYLYWNSSCLASCPSPYSIRTQYNKNFCDFGCTASQYLYWDSSCSDTCLSPNVIRNEAGMKYCDYPCSSGYLYWNGSCLSTCASPLKTRYTQNRWYCDYPCSTSQFLYWNGSCFSGCAFPLTTRVESDRNYCDYSCTGSNYLYWNGTCGTCSSPLTTRTTAGDRYCDYKCTESQFLYWDGTCQSSCLEPRTLVTEGTPARNYCRFSCNTNEYLYWNGTCASTCLSPLTSNTYNSRFFCQYKCALTEVLHWDGTCQTSCPLPYSFRLEATRNYCDFPCPSGQFLYWNGTCSAFCSSPLTTQTISSQKFCYFPCSETEFLYWDGSCSATCPSPLSQTIEGTSVSRKFCRHNCSTTSDFLYWDGSCAASCNSPLVTQTIKNRKICESPCDPSYYIYWDGSCVSNCPSPLTSTTKDGLKYCSTGCLSTEFLYWNGSCLSYCNSLFIQRTDKNRLFCDYPCLGTEYLYWNGTCKNECPTPFVSTEQTSIGNRKFCDFPCSGRQFLNWDEECQDTCDSPYRQAVSTSGKYCSMPCSTKTEYYYPDLSSCSTTCESPYESNTTLPYLQCIKATVTETPVEEEKRGPVFTALLMAPTENGTFTIVKVVKVMQYMRFLEIKLPPRLEQLGSSQGRSILSFQSKSRLLSEKSGVSDIMQSSLPSFFSRHDLDSTFIVNFWGNFLFILSAVLAAGVFTLLEKFCYNLEWRLLGAVFMRLRIIVRWNLFIMLIATNIDDIILYTTIEFKSIHTTALPTVNQFSLAMCVIFLILTAVLLIGIFLLIRKYYRDKKSIAKSNKQLLLNEFEAKWIDMQVVLRGFRTNTRWNRYFYLIYTFRIGFPMFITVCAVSVPLLITITQLLVSVFIMLYLIRIKPFKRLINQIQLLIFETLVLLMNLCMFILTVMYTSGSDVSDDFSAVLGDIVILGNDAINLMTPICLGIRVLMEARAIYIYIKSLNDKSLIEKTRYIQLIGLFFQQANMGFEEILEDNTPLPGATPLSSVSPTSRQQDLSTTSRKGLVSQKSEGNKPDYSMESQILDDTSRIIVVSNGSQVFVRSDSKRKTSEDNHLMYMRSDSKRKLSDDTQLVLVRSDSKPKNSDDTQLPDIVYKGGAHPSKKDISPLNRKTSLDFENDHLDTSVGGIHRKKLEVVLEEPLKAVKLVKDRMETPNFNDNIYIFDITKGAEENEVEIKPIKLKSKIEELKRKNTMDSDSGSTTSPISRSRSQSKPMLIDDPNLTPESPTLLNGIQEEQSPSAQGEEKKPPKSKPVVFRSFYTPIVTKIKRPEGTKKTKMFLNYDWKNVSPELESPISYSSTNPSPELSPIKLEKTTSNDLMISDMDDLRRENSLDINLSSMVVDSTNNVGSPLRKFTTLRKESAESVIVKPALRRSPSDYLKNRLSVEARTKSPGKGKSVAFNF